MITDREHEIDVEILRFLQSSGGYLQLQDRVVNHVTLKVTPAPMKSEVDGRLRYLDAESRVRPLTTERGNKWGITDEGQAYLANL